MNKPRLFLFLFLLLAPGIVFLFGCGGGGSSSTVTTIPRPSPLDSLSVTAVSGNGSVTLGWSSIASATSYRIYRSLTSGQTGTQITSQSSSVFHYIDGDLENGTTYYYLVEAEGDSGVLGQSAQVGATPVASSGGSILISGVVRYQDKEYGIAGFTGNQPYKAVRYATVEIVSATYGVLASAATDSQGMFSIATAPTSTVYVRVNAEARLPESTSFLLVKDLAANIFAVRGNDFAASGSAQVNIDISSDSIGGAFNILDVFTISSQFVHSLANTYPPSLSAFWQPENSGYGTYYCDKYDQNQCIKDEGIYVLSDPADKDEYDDDVIYHEFGHFISTYFSRDESPGGYHGLQDNDLDMRMAWSEGWGDAFPGLIKIWLSGTRPELLSSAPATPLTEYIDTIATGAGIAIDMGDPDGAYRHNYYYACSEVAIAKILLGLNKHFGMQPLWDVIYSYKQTVPTSPVNLELFWDRWHGLGLPTTDAAITIESLFADRFVFYSPDQYEPGDESTASPYIGPQNHTLYGPGDIDIVSFNTTAGQSYTIRTSNLTNGADTVITLLAGNGTIISTNDNSENYGDWSYKGSMVPSDFFSFLYYYGVRHDNGEDILGSRITFTATSAGPYYIKIESSASRPVSAGRYGNYTLSITSP